MFHTASSQPCSEPSARHDGQTRLHRCARINRLPAMRRCCAQCKSERHGCLGGAKPAQQLVLLPSRGHPALADGKCYCGRHCITFRPRSRRDRLQVSQVSISTQRIPHKAFTATGGYHIFMCCRICRHKQHMSSLSWSGRGKDCDLEIALPTTMIPYASAAKVRTATLLD